MYEPERPRHLSGKGRHEGLAIDGLRDFVMRRQRVGRPIEGANPSLPMY